MTFAILCVGKQYICWVLETETLFEGVLVFVLKL